MLLYQAVCTITINRCKLSVCTTSSFHLVCKMVFFLQIFIFSFQNIIYNKFWSKSSIQIKILLFFTSALTICLWAVSAFWSNKYMRCDKEAIYYLLTEFTLHGNKSMAIIIDHCSEGVK